MEELLKDNNKEINSLYKEGKSVVAKRFNRSLKDKIYEYMIVVLKNVRIH